MSEFGSSAELLAGDLSLPKATVQKILNEILPSDIVFSKEAREALIQCCVEFIMIVATESNDIAEQNSKKTIGSEHVIKAIEALGFNDYIGLIQQVLEDHKLHRKGRDKKSKKLQNSGLSEEELIKTQQKLFGQAKSRLSHQSATSSSVSSDVSENMSS